MYCIRSPALSALRTSRSLIHTRKLSTVRDLPHSATTIPYQVLSSGAVLQNATSATGPRTNWTREEISEIYNTPLFELHYAAVRIFLC
jgi:biotin synthase